MCSGTTGPLSAAPDGAPYGDRFPHITIRDMVTAELALAGIRSRIPADEVIDAMRAVGDLMSPLLKETGRGGVAASPTAVRFRNDFFGKTQE